jgi:hypothetical protein
MTKGLCASGKSVVWAVEFEQMTMDLCTPKQRELVAGEFSGNCVRSLGLLSIKFNLL